MIKFIDIYAQTFVSNELQTTYSKTARTVKELKSKSSDFDAILAQHNASYARTPVLPEHEDRSFAETEQIFLRAKNTQGVDPIFNNGAQRKYEELHDLFSRADPILAAHRNLSEANAT